MSPEQPPSSAPRPSGPKVFGILSIIFASMTIFSCVLGGFSISLNRGGSSAALAFAAFPGASTAMAEAYQRYFASTFVARLAQLGLLLAFSILLLFLGIGQLRYRHWARLGSQAWGAAGLLATGVMELLSCLVIRPATKEMMESLMKAMPVDSPEAAVMGWMGSLLGGGGMSGIVLLFYVPYPLLLLIYFSRASVRQAMTAEP